MENILKIIYDKSFENKILDLKDIEKILELLVINKCLGNYILNIDIQPIRSNNLASYSTFTKNIIIYTGTLELMVKNIEKNILIASDIEKNLYKNLSILQILLHEVEHANQEKILYTENSLEAFIIRMSCLVSNSYNENLYEYCPEERLAEIKSFEEILSLITIINNKLEKLSEIIETEKLQRLLRGYHYSKSLVNCPLITYFKLGNKEEILQSFDWYSDTPENALSQASNIYNLNLRMKFGFPIALNEYGESMKSLVLSLNNNFKNRTNIKLKI